MGAVKFLFKHGRFLGVHNPFGRALGKARDPYINRWTLNRLLKHKDPQVRKAARKNLSTRGVGGFKPIVLEDRSSFLSMGTNSLLSSEEIDDFAKFSKLLKNTKKLLKGSLIYAFLAGLAFAWGEIHAPGKSKIIFRALGIVCMVFSTIQSLFGLYLDLAGFDLKNLLIDRYKDNGIPIEFRTINPKAAGKLESMINGGWFEKFNPF
jgi:hypothetical protein